MAHAVEKNADGKLVVAISSRALFDLDKSHKIFKEQGVEAYAKHQQENEDVVLKPGVGFTLVRKLLNLNSKKHRLMWFCFLATVPIQVCVFLILLNTMI
ncbi:5'-nucleotidase (EC [uncultured Gammaproteobacteria bacterium]|nr:5'-nucleotidase (EC [uncultured Gammaproteobacteria bacterium]